MKSHPFLYLKPEKRNPLRAEASRKGHYRKYGTSKIAHGLFTVPYFVVRSWRSSALHNGRPSWFVSNLLRGWGTYNARPFDPLSKPRWRSVRQSTGCRCSCGKKRDREQSKRLVNWLTKCFFSVPASQNCTAAPCQHGARCLDNKNTTGFTCVCSSGYSGQRCEIAINQCASGPCKNGATCIDDVNNVTCTCAKGFTGIVLTNEAPPHG